MKNLDERRAAFRKLHEQGCFVMPNPWDRGSAVFLARVGFKALATTSAGFAFSRALPDSPLVLTRDAILDHVADLAASTELPVNTDFQSGYGATPKDVAESVRLCVEAGTAGLSIEDATGDPGRPLYEISEAVERLAGARGAVDASRTGTVLTARAECFLTGHPEPLDESIRRLRAYAAAGADVLYAPGLRDREAIRAVVEAVAPKPVNVLMSGQVDLSVTDLAELGVRRISVGSALARCAWTGFAAAARAIAETGRFTSLAGIMPNADLNRLFG